MSGKNSFFGFIDKLAAQTGEVALCEAIKKGFVLTEATTMTTNDNIFHKCVDQYKLPTDGGATRRNPHGEDHVMGRMVVHSGKRKNSRLFGVQSALAQTSYGDAERMHQYENWVSQTTGMGGENDYDDLTADLQLLQQYCSPDANLYNLLNTKGVVEFFHDIADKVEALQDSWFAAEGDGSVDPVGMDFGQ